MIKLDNTIMQEVDSHEQEGYWMDFDESKAAFTMEVNDITLDEYLSDAIRLMEV